MRNKLIFTVLTFLCMLSVDSISAQDYNGGNGGSNLDDPSYLWNLGWLNEVCVGAGCNMNHLDNVNVQNNFTEDYIYLWNVLHSFEAYDYDFSSGGSGAADAEALLHQIEENPQFFLWFKDEDTDAFHSAVAITKEYISPGVNDPVDHWYLGTSMGKDCDDTFYNLANQCSPGFIITDGSNPERKAEGGKPLVMVKNGSDRTANISLAFDKFTPAIGGGYPIWSGTGITGHGISASYSGTTSSNFSMKVTQQLSSTGNIEIVNENKISFSQKIKDVETVINAVTDNFRSYVESKGNKVSDGSKTLSLTGSLEKKNVDYYNDGTRNGVAIAMDLTGSYSLSMPTIKIPFFTSLLASANAFLSLGNATGTVKVQGTIDDSTAAKVELEGGFELGFTAMSAGVEAILGVDDVLCAAAEGKIETGYFTVGGKVYGDSNLKAVLLQPELKTGTIKISYDIRVKAGTSNTCTLDKGEYPLIDENNVPFQPVILYQDNN